MARYNSASRLLTYIERIPSVGDVPTVADGWAHVFELAEPDETERDALVIQRLGLLREQLLATKRALIAKGVTSTTWEESITRVGLALGPRLLGQKWGTATQHLLPQVLSVLRLLPEFLEDEGSVASMEELAQARARLDEVDGAIDGSHLPPEVVAFLKRQVRFAKEALDQLPFRGAAAFRDASDRSAQEWLANAEEIGPYKDNTVVLDVWDLWPRFEKWGKRTVLIGNLAFLLFVKGPAILKAIDEHHLLPSPRNTELPVPPQPDALPSAAPREPDPDDDAA